MVDRSSAGALLRRARKRAGLTQAEHAQRAGVTQSVISAYEAGRRQPAIDTLARLINAAGYDLALSLHVPPPSLDHLTGPIGQRVRLNRRHLIRVASAHGVSSLQVFGSVARGHEHARSDVDLLADIPASMGLFELGQLTAELEAILGAPVDLVPREGLKLDARKRVETEAIRL